MNSKTFRSVKGGERKKTAESITKAQNYEKSVLVSATDVGERERIALITLIVH